MLYLCGEFHRRRCLLRVPLLIPCAPPSKTAALLQALIHLDLTIPPYLKPLRLSFFQLICDCLMTISNRPISSHRGLLFSSTYLRRSTSHFGFFPTIRNYPLRSCDQTPYYLSNFKHDEQTVTSPFKIYGLRYIRCSPQIEGAACWISFRYIDFFQYCILMLTHHLLRFHPPNLLLLAILPYSSLIDADHSTSKHNPLHLKTTSTTCALPSCQHATRPAL